jgi:signal transduction histidine kinase
MTLRLWPHSLVGRVFALYTVVLLAFVGAGLGVFYRYQFTVELEDAQLRADTLSSVIVPTLSDSAVIGDYDTIRRTLERAVYHSAFAAASFIDLKGGVVRAPHVEPPAVPPPRWLLDAVAERLYDSNQPIKAGGRDYGVLRLSFAADRIAGQLWQQTRVALWLALGSVAGGLLLIRWPLVRWLGKLDRVQAFEEAMDRGDGAPALPLGDDLPLEFRKTFEVLDRAAQRLRAELQQREAALVSLRNLLEGLLQRAPVAGIAPGTDDLQAITAMIAALVTRLQERSEQLDAIFALSPDGFVSFDAARRANYVSPAFERLTGLAASRVLGAGEAEIEGWLRGQCAPGVPWRSLEALRREQRQQAGAAMPGGGERSHAKATPPRTQIALLRPTRRVLDVGLREGSTPAISQVLSLRDVTHETEVDRMKSEFLSTAAHELRTPMASIFGFSELMMRRPLRPEQQQEVISTIHRQTALMIAIVNELLDLARIEARRGANFELQTLDLATLVQDMVNDFRPPNERAAPTLTLGAGPWPVRVDRNKLAQALGNVLSNAYKYSPAGGAVRLALVPAGSARGQGAEGSAPRSVGLQVRDAGIGMTPEQLARVSERFYRGDASGTIPGTGLGMSIVKEIIELLGGRMALASTPGAGSTVTLWLPLADDSAPAAPASSAQEHPLETA